MKNSTIGIIGAGNMGMALAAGLARDQTNGRIMVSRLRAERQEMARTLGIVSEPDNGALATQADTLILAVKPQQLKSICAEIASAAMPRPPLVVSIVAGVRAADIDRWLGGGYAVVRAMPNTPALANAGVSTLFANARTSASERALAQHILSSVSRVFWLADETLMDATTALAGSGPAYLFLFVEALTEAGVKAGLNRELSADLATHTVVGAATLLQTSKEAPSVLRERVTSKGGTTEQAVKSLLADGFMDMFDRAIRAAASRSKQLGEQWSGL